MGSIITVRRGRGMGQLDMEGLLPVLIGGGLTALTALGIRHFVKPSEGETNKTLFKWAPLVGHAVGVASSAALYFLGGRNMNAAAQSFLSATAVGLYGVASDMIVKEKAGQFALAFAEAAPAAAGNGNGNGNGTVEGFGAIVPEYSRGMGAIAMEQIGPGGRRAGTIGSYGEVVSLNGINTNAFGTPGFQA